MIKINWLKNQNWVTLLGVVLAVLLIFAAIFRLLTPTSIKLTKPEWDKGLDTDQSSFDQVVYQGPEISVPSSMTISQVQFNDLTSNLLRDLQLNFDLKPTLASQVWVGPSHSLTHLPEENRLILTMDVGQESGGSISLEQAITSAQKFIDLYLNQYQVVPQRQLVRYYQSGNELVRPVEPANAGLVVVPFAFSINQYPVYYQNQSMTAIEFTINAHQQLIKIDLHTQVVNFQPTTEEKTLTLHQALININQYQLGSVIAVGYNSPGLLALDKIQSGQLLKAQLEYRVSPNSDYSYPYFHFFGTLTDGDGREFDGEIITPAIELEPTN